MHDGCSGSFKNGEEIALKVRSMGFSEQPMPMALTITCVDCKNDFEMETYESICPHCQMIYAVTPCHAFDADNVMAAGKNK